MCCHLFHRLPPSSTTPHHSTAFYLEFWLSQSQSPLRSGKSRGPKPDHRARGLTIHLLFLVEMCQAMFSCWCKIPIVSRTGTWDNGRYPGLGNLSAVVHWPICWTFDMASLEESKVCFEFSLLDGPVVWGCIHQLQDWAAWSRQEQSHLITA